MESLETNLERKILPIFLLLIALFSTIDIVEDLDEGVLLVHIVWEICTILLCVSAGVYHWIASAQRARLTQQTLLLNLKDARADAARFQLEAAAYLSGLGQAIDTQFGDWGLSAAEKEVALLLLKGFSHKEIANLRSTSEGTVRQQSASVYAKASIEGRAQLSAFFLEDLLLPSSRVA